MTDAEGLHTLGHDVVQCVFAVHQGDPNRANAIRLRHGGQEFLHTLATFAATTFDSFATAKGIPSDALFATFIDAQGANALVRDVIRFVRATHKNDPDAAREARAMHGDEAVFTLAVASFAKNAFLGWAAMQGDSPDVAWKKLLETEPTSARAR